jgi:cell shape-determining protein MreD
MLLMLPIVGSHTDSTYGAVQWQAVPMDAVVVIVLSLCLVGIVAAGVMTIGVALSRKQG